MSMNAAYGSENRQGWTRIEMLLALYRETISELEKVAAAQPDSANIFRHRMKAMSLVAAIESGTDVRYGDVPRNVLRLCRFVRDSLVSCKPENMRCSVQVMQELYEGFSAIRSPAIKLELCGETPRLDSQATIEVDA